MRRKADQLHPQRPTVRIDSDPTRPLLSVLREDLALRGSRFGCGTEQCGACMVLIDGEPAYSCAREVATVAGRRITTVEGLARNGELHPLQQAFIDEQAGQCGYCLSGILISAAALLARNQQAEPRRGRGRARPRICAAAACTTASSARCSGPAA